MSRLQALEPPPGGPYGTAPTLRPPPQVIENMLDELEEKVRHYFLLYTREKKAREKTERYNYWLQKELAEQKEKLISNAEYIESLQQKFDELRGDPEMVRDTLQRIDLMYAQVDTLVQALAGVCGFAAVKEASREQLLQCALDYLYPCRALDPRLHELYGLLYYYRLGEAKVAPSPPPPPPEPTYAALTEGAGGMWIRPSPYTIFKTPGVGDSPFQRGLAETRQILDAEAAAKAEAEKEAEKKAAEAAKPEQDKPAVGAIKKIGAGTSTAAGKVGAAKPDAKKEAKAATPEKSGGGAPSTASDPPTREPVDPKAALKGMSVFVRRLENFKRPPSSKEESLRIAVRMDGESATEVKRKDGRFFVVDKCGGSPGKEEATFNLLVEFPSLPAPKPGGNPKFIIDVYDNKGFTALGRADKPFNDKDLPTKDAVWEIKDNAGKAFGKLICTVTPIPLNAPLPCEGSGGAKADAGAKKADPPKEEKASPAIKKPDLPKPGGAAAPTPAASPKADNGKAAEAKTPAAPAGGIKKPDLPKPAGVGAKLQPKVSGVAEIKKPELGAKPAAGGVVKPGLPPAKGAGDLAANKEGPGGAPGAGALAKPPLMPGKSGVGLVKPDLNKKPVMASASGVGKPSLLNSAKSGMFTAQKSGVLATQKSGLVTPQKSALLKPAVASQKSGVLMPVKPPGPKPGGAVANSPDAAKKVSPPVAPAKPDMKKGTETKPLTSSKPGTPAPAKPGAGPPAKPGAGPPAKPGAGPPAKPGAATPKKVDAKPATTPKKLEMKPSIVAKKLDTKPSIIAKKLDTKPSIIAKKLDTKPSIIAKKLDTKPSIIAKKLDAKPSIVLKKPDIKAAKSILVKPKPKA
ncbi:variable surface lipoprotein [Besnoitia besnoiti]|uniref:Variable surface lipoprotein n=1 Tax=Besnoitia besnoiti TaxID=94643 RepID=A0A2A9M3I0_BESBE|nr:variable surface lipoprotein [Besnoitia besnoiti]PFH32515.1 variable surface lipoprotein [Besnoitia besnoiti]